MNLKRIDTVTNLVELVRIDDKRSETVARKFAQCWLTHYMWGSLTTEPYSSGDDFCALIAFSQSKLCFFSMMKFFAAASSVSLKTNSGGVGSGLTSCLTSWMTLMSLTGKACLPLPLLWLIQRLVLLLFCLLLDLN
jgi:hypothetical protein